MCHILVYFVKFSTKCLINGRKFKEKTGPKLVYIIYEIHLDVKFNCVHIISSAY